MKPVVLATLLLSAAALSFVATPAMAQWQPQSLYTEDGVEVGVDGRVFTLFAMLNALGFDDDSARGPAPVRKPLHAAARTKARQNLGRPGPSLKALDGVLAKNPLERSAYVAAVLELGPAPNFDDKGASALGKAIAGPMRDWFNEEGGAGILKIVAEEAKPQQKKLLPLLDKAVKQTHALVRLGDKQDQLLDDSGAQGRVSVVLNDLDAHSTLQRVQRGDVTYLVVGPSAGEPDEKGLVTGVVAAVARTLVSREAPKGAKAGGLAGEDKNKATELLACGFMQKVRGRDAACVGSPLESDTASAEALKVLAPRIDAFASDSAVLSASVEKLLEPAPASASATPAPAAPAPVEEKKGKGKKGKGT
jgi:hypothetical protein